MKQKIKNTNRKQTKQKKIEIFKHPDPGVKGFFFFKYNCKGLKSILTNIICYSN